MDGAGSILVTGSEDNGTDTDLLILKIASNGTFDTGFGTGGVLTIDSGMEDDSGNGIAAGSSFFVAGTWAESNAITLKFAGPAVPAEGITVGDGHRCSAGTARNRGAKGFLFLVAVILLAGLSRRWRHTL